jgi:hypothetical protein
MIVLAQEVRSLRAAVAIHLFMQIDIELSIFSRPHHRAKDEQTMHLKHDLNLLVLFFYQAGPDLKRNVLITIFVQPERAAFSTS